MSSYQTAGSSGVFSYELNYSHDSQGWAMSSLNVQKQGRIVFSKRHMTGIYRSEAVLLAQGINMCEAIANHLRATA